MNRVRATDLDQRRTILWAVVISLVLHALLVLVSLRFPLGSVVRAALDVEPAQAITFQFDRDVEPTTTDPQQDARFLPIEPDPSPAPQPPLDGVEAEPAVPALEQPSTRPTDEPPAPPAEVESADPPREDPGPAAAPVQAGPGPASRSSRGKSEPRVDLQQALRDFGRARAELPPGAPGAPSVATPRSVYVPDLSSVPHVGYGLGNLTFESGDYDWQDYARQIYTAIWRAWHRRLWMTTDEFEKWSSQNGRWMLDHLARVSFVIERNGHVTGIVEQQGSDCAPFDVSVLEALSEVILPPLPADFPRDRETVRGTFIGQGPIRGMRPNLSRLERAGLF